MSTAPIFFKKTPEKKHENMKPMENIKRHSITPISNNFNTRKITVRLLGLRGWASRHSRGGTGALGRAGTGWSRRSSFLGGVQGHAAEGEGDDAGARGHVLLAQLPVHGFGRPPGDSHFCGNLLPHLGLEPEHIHGSAGGWGVHPRGVDGWGYLS